MKAFIEQLFHMSLESFNIWSDSGEVLYTAKREGVVGSRFRLFDASGREIAFIKQKIPSIRPSFILTIHDQDIKVIEKCKINGCGYCKIEELGIETEGNMDGHVYTINRNGSRWAEVRPADYGGTVYEIEYPEGSNTDELMAVFLALELAVSVR